MGSREGHKVQKDARGCTSTTISTHPARRRPVADSHAGAASTWLDATSTFDDELGPILGTTKQNNRQNISFGPARSAAELEAAEAAKERYREALRDARGYVSETVTPQKQHPVAQPPRGASSKDEDDEYAEDSNDGDEFVEDNDHALLTVEAEAKVAPLQLLHLLCRVSANPFNRKPLSLRPAPMQSRQSTRRRRRCAGSRLLRLLRWPLPQRQSGWRGGGWGRRKSRRISKISLRRRSPAGGSGRSGKHARRMERQRRRCYAPPQPCTPRHAPCAHATCTLYACGARRKRCTWS